MEDFIIQAVSEYCRISLRQMRSDDRSKNIVRARHLVFYFLRGYSKLSLTQIGALMYRDHATVIHGCISIKNQLESYNCFRKEIEPLESRIKGIIQGYIQAEDEVFMEPDYFTN